jgi:hypothetical protein
MAINKALDVVFAGTAFEVGTAVAFPTLETAGNKVVAVKHNIA